ncbi:aromatic ring-hydroxylating oxygenase subunit alpha [Sphingomonas jaspsi]|uniref:aromatic ring-hydroxylating oxygenase subunit alpha n=1 Tax=Sphingomonas jaspsi TaxID=392409 RepID=UPI0004B1AD17|nr:aromatic ring-hydroxylating dioxygenase subunit alpha [Sphingomonas jaspsi]
MTVGFRGWDIHIGAPHPFNDRAPEIDNGTARPDPKRYYDKDIMAAEWDRVWTRTWLLAAVEADLRETGDFVRFDIGHESFIVVRAEDGTIKAHYNVCPHRGSRLVLSDFGSLDGFTCPFHSWQFDLDGQNTRVTDAETFEPAVLCHGTDLTSVRCETVAGLVFITMRDDLLPVREWLGPVADHLALYDPASMNVIHHKQSDWGANWKGGVDAFYELYHLHSVHPQTQCVMDDRTQIDLYPNGMSRQFVPFAQPSPRYPDQQTVNPGIQMMLADAGIDPESFEGTAQDSRAAIQAAKRERAAKYGLDYDKFSDTQLSDSTIYGIFPNVQIGCHPEALFIHRFLPHPTDPEQFTYDNLILFRHVDAPGYKAPAWMGLGDEVDTTGMIRPDIARVPLGVPPELGEVLDQDSELLPIVQQGAKSRGFKGPLWSYQEGRLRHFHTELDRYLSGEK